MRKPRLTEIQVEGIKAAFLQCFPSDSQLYLFGSRADPGKKGGDIDFYIETPLESADEIVAAKIRFLTLLYIKIGEQKIDVVVKFKNGFAHPSGGKTGRDSVNMTKTDLLKSEIEVCDLQLARMEMAHKHLESIFPLTKEKFLHLSDEEMGFLDMLTTRYSKLQDLIGNKVFPLFLTALEENIEGASALDRIHRLEKLGYLKSSEDWIAMRAVRNSIAHEYPDNPDLMVSNINAAVVSSRNLKSYWQKLRAQILEKMRGQ